MLQIIIKRAGRSIGDWAEKRLGIQVFPRDRILSAVSTDGCHWQREPGIRVDVGGRHGSEMVYWPFVLKFPECWRMYFDGAVRTTAGWTERILSAVSEDGLSWVSEAGERVSPGGKFDSRFAAAPWVVQAESGYRMYYAGGRDSLNWSILSAFSADGLVWRKEGGVRLASLEGVSDYVHAPCVIPAENGWRMYFTCARGCRLWLDSARSGDGLSWSYEKGLSLGLKNSKPRKCICHPCVVAAAGGQYRMYFTGHDGSAYASRIYSAISGDGLDWVVEGECLDYSGPFEGGGVGFCRVVKAAPSLWRMYYTGFWGRHLLSPLTYRHWKTVARRIESELEIFL